ncbi:MAG: hypothetical protein ACI9DJ_002062 [Algoriphagus sp.]|jgi:hypothetical protein
MTDKTSKPRVVKDYDKLEPEIREQIKLTYPFGFADYLIRFTNQQKKYISALPFETDEKYYLIRMTSERAEEIIEDDEDYDDDGNLKDDVREEYEEKFDDLDYISPVEEVDEDQKRN